MKFKPLSPLFIGSLALIIGANFMTAKMIGVRFRTANILSSVTATVPAPVASLSIRADFVSYLYRCMLQREPDQAGLDFWVGTMASDPDPVNHLYRAFYAAQDQSLNNTAFVTEMYNCVLFRNPNDLPPPDNNFSGRDFWANEMSLGYQTQASMLEVFLGSLEYNTDIFPKLSALPVNLPTPTPTPTPIPTPTPSSSLTPSPTPTPILVNPVSISLSASAIAVSSGQTVYLSWSVANASDGTIIFNNGIGTVGTSGNRVVNPTTTTTYTLSGSNSLGTVSRSVTVTIVSVAPSVSISSPQPGESWTVGTTHPIVWASNQSSSTTVTILISGGTITSNASNNNLYNWTIPSNFTPGQYTLTISVNGTIATGQSGIFNINPVSTPFPTPTPTFTTTPTPSATPTLTPTPTPTPTPIPTTGPAGYTFCVFENQSCTFSNTRSVAYGANGQFNYLTLTGGTNCSNTIFNDPVVGVVKACYIKDAVTPTPSFTPTPTPTPIPTTIIFPTTTDNLLSHLYSCVLGRTSLVSQDDPNGFSFWRKIFLTNGDLPQLYHAFYESGEFGKRNLNNADFTTSLYNCALFRDPNNAGFADWLSALNAGSTNRNEMLDPGFLQSWEFQNIVSPKLMSLRPAISTQINLDSHLAVTHVSGFYPNYGGDFMVKGAQDARNLGFQGIELYMAPEICNTTKDSTGNVIKSGSYQTLDWCDSHPGPSNISPNYHSLAELAANPRYQNVFNQSFKNYFITAETINPDRVYPEPSDCIAAELNRINTFNVAADCYKNGFSQRQLKSLHDDFYNLFRYLLQTYASTGKTFVVISGNELENHFEVKVEGKATYPDWAMNNMVSYLNTVSQALADAKVSVPSQGVSVYHGCEFATLNDNTLAGGRDGINNVVPRTHCDLYGWSAWDYTVYHPTDDNFITKGLNYYASKAPDSPAFGNHNVFLSEFGSPEHYHPADQNIKLLNNGVDKALAWGSPYVLYWQLYDNSCDSAGQVFPVTSESQCPGFWLRKPASDPTKLGPLSDIYTQVFAPRREP